MKSTVQAACHADPMMMVASTKPRPAPAASAAYAQFAAPLRDLQAWCHGAQVKAGWWTNLTTGESLTGSAEGHIYYPPKFNIAEKLCLIHSEVSEAMEGARKGSMDDKLPHRTMLEVELADAVIRCLDLAGALGLDIAGALVEKMEFNACRADHKLANRSLEGGKKF